MKTINPAYASVRFIGNISALNNIIANSGTFSTLSANIIFADSISPGFISGNSGTFSTITSNSGYISTLGSNNIFANSGYISTLGSNNIFANSGTFSTITSNSGYISTLGSNNIFVTRDITASTGNYSNIAIFSSGTYIQALNEEQSELIPAVIWSSAGTLATPTTANGGTYNIRAVINVGRCTAGFSAVGSIGTFTVAIYQRFGGSAATTANPANLIATFTSTSQTVGTVNVILRSTGTGILSPGVCYVLWGRIGGGMTSRVYNGVNIPGLNANLPAGVAPVQFTTTYSIAALPATFDPTDTVNVTPSIANVMLVTRFLR